MYSEEHKRFIRKKKITSILVHLVQILLIVSLIVIWELLAKYEVINTFISSSPSRIVNTIIKNNNINNEETTKDKEIATLKDFIVYKKNFYIIEDKYENILVCRNLNTNIKKYINCYEDYTIMNKNPQRKRS